MTRPGVFCFALACASAIGCKQASVEWAPLAKLPLIDGLTDSVSPKPCHYLKIDTPHSGRVCAFVEFGELIEMQQVLPFIKNQKPMKGADGLNGRIPQQLLDTIKNSAPFTTNDKYWIVEVVSENMNRSFSVYVGYSEEGGRCYIDYSWAH